MKKVREIFVELVAEDLQVWRPVQAELLHGDVYRIMDQPYDREIEMWQFQPGDDVVCKMLEASEGPILAAVSLYRR